MQASIENLEGLKRLVTVTVPAEDVKKAYAASLRNAAKSARIDGFRKGHVPTKILESYYGPSIIGDTYDQLVRRTIEQAMKDCSVDPVGMPEISFEKSSYDKDGDFVYTAEIEVAPTLEDKPLSEITVKVLKSTVNDADIDKMIHTLQSQQAKWQVNDEAAAEMGKLVKIDFVGRVDGVEFEGGRAQDFSLHLGKTSMIPGFSEAIVGHKAGEKFTINVTFPEEYHAENLKGKPAEFDITVNSVSDQILPELNDDFFKLFGVEDGSLESFRAALRTNMEREQSRALFNAQRNNIADAMLNAFGDFEVPKAAVEQERKRICDSYIERLKSYGVPVKVNPYEDDPEANKEEAVRNVRASYAMQHYVAKSGITAPSEETIDEQLHLIADAYDDPDAVIREIKKDSRQLASIREVAFERDFYKYVESNANCDVQEMTFSELMGMQDEQF